MALVTESKKACTKNPLKLSQPLGAAFAFMGLESCMPLMHGSQGCTSFALVLLVRHFKEAIPLQTRAMNEATTILGGYDNLEKALLNIRSRARPALIAICSTGLTETKGDDVRGFIRLARQKHPELADTAIVHFRATCMPGLSTTPSLRPFFAREPSRSTRPPDSRALPRTR